MNQKTSYSTHDVARIIGVSSPTVIKWCNTGVLECFRTPGGHRRITVDALKLFASKHNYPLNSPTPVTIPKDASSNRSIVIVDSDIELGEMIKEYIEEEFQYIVHLADNVQMAGLLIGYYAPKLVVIDMSQHQSLGMQLSKHIRALFGSGKIKFISYSAFFNPKQTPVDGDFDAFILKTEPITSLFTAIDDIMS